MSAQRLVLALALVAAATGDASAREPSFSAAAKAGGFFPQPFSELGTNLVIGLEGGWLPPVACRRLHVAVALEYAQPPAEGRGSDPGVGGSYAWSLQQRELSLAALAAYRFDFFGERVVPYAGLGPRLILLETRANGAAAGEPFGEHVETSTELGLAVQAGADWRLGPGTVVGELQVGVSDLDHVTTGDVTGGALAVRVGYRLWF